MNDPQSGQPVKRCRCCHAVLPLAAFPVGRGSDHRRQPTAYHEPHRALCGPCLRRVRREAKAERRKRAMGA